MEAVNASEIDCDNQNNIICYYEEAEKIFKQNYDAEYWLEQSLYDRAQEYYKQFIKSAEKEKNEFETDHLIKAYIGKVLTNNSKKYLDPKKIEENIKYFDKSIDLGADWVLLHKCEYLYKLWQWNDKLSEELSEIRENYLKDSKKSCEKFIEIEAYNSPVYKKESDLYKIWNISIQEEAIFLVYHKLTWIYNDLENSSKSVDMALRAEKELEQKKYKWDSFFTDKDHIHQLFSFLGYAFDQGWGVEKNIPLAHKYREIASNKGNYEATLNIAIDNFSGVNIPLNLKKAITYFEKAIEIKPSEFAANRYLLDIYLYGFGVDIDTVKAKHYLEEIKLIANEKLENPIDYYQEDLDTAKAFKSFAVGMLSEWKNGEYSYNDDDVCDFAETSYNQGRNAYHILNACEYVANQGHLYSKIAMIDFYAYGTIVTKNTELSNKMTKNLIIELEESVQNKNWDKFKLKQGLDPETEYYKYIEYLKVNIAQYIFQGEVQNEPPQVAYKLLEEILFIDNKRSETIKNPVYISDWYMYNLMQIDGWGTKQNLEEAKRNLIELKTNYLFLKENPDQLPEYFPQENIDLALTTLSNVNDRLNQVGAGYISKSRAILSFPAIFSGEFLWHDSLRPIAVQIKFNKIRRIGYDIYKLKGVINFSEEGESHTDSNQYLLSGNLNTETNMVTFEEIDTGNSATLDLDHISGKYYVKFNEDFKSFNGQFIGNRNYDFASFELFKKENSESKVDYKKRIGIGKQYALLIGNNDYENLEKLETATADARSLADILKNKYGFIVEPPLIDVTRNEILMKLSHLSNVLNPDDSLLIFYAGHGRQDEDTGRGYWSPVDAYADNFINDISNDDITNLLKKINAKHILVIADSCYSGTLVLRGESLVNKSNNVSFFKELAKKESRKALTSGALQPVSDTGENGHSAFANSLLKVLVENEKIISANELHQNIRPMIMSKYSQTPLYNIVGNAGDEGGEFLFIPIQ